MAKLLDLFESRESDIYGKFKQKSSGEDEPYIVIPLSEAEPMDPFFEDQSNPISLSARRDLRRMANFSTSTQGLVFLAKQQLLQSGNTFANTRLYNPANILIHAVPFVHAKRHLDLRGEVIQNILEAVGVEFGNPNPQTSLQKETVRENTFYNRDGWAWRNLNTRGGILLNTNNTVDISSGRSIRNSLLNLGKDFARRAIDQIISPVTRTISGIDAQLNGGLGQSRPEINGNRSVYYDEVSKQYGQYTDENPFSDVPNEQSGISYVQALRQWKKEGNDRISIGVDDEQSATDGRKFVAQKRYYKDLTQIERNSLPFIGTEDEFVSTLDSDSVDVLFRVRNPDTKAFERVRFRAFIEGIQESISPSYGENKYVGRYEKYYTYQSTIRDVSFNLMMHAFSEEEMENVVRKMTYLSSLAYPIKSGDIPGNYLTPLILQFTIGQLYVNQPAILFGLQHTIEEDTSWDIDKQMPMTINSSLNLRLLDRENYDYRLMRTQRVPFGQQYMLRPSGFIVPTAPPELDTPTAPDFSDLNI